MEDLQRFCNENQINACFAGKVDYDQIAIYYRSSDVFVIPTLQDNWSLGVPEAIACGLPVACSQYNGCHPELVTSENGWVFEPMDYQNTSSVIKVKK